MWVGSRAWFLGVLPQRASSGKRLEGRGSEERVGSFSLQGSSSFCRTVWQAFPENHSDATRHLTNLILFLSSSRFLPTMGKTCLKSSGMKLRFPAFWLG